MTSSEASAPVSGRPWLQGDCAVCPLAPARVVRGYGVGGGLAIIGESPGKLEVMKGRPFIGPSGKLIRAVLGACGQDPEEVYWTNTVLCHSPKKPVKDAIEACNQRLRNVELPMVAPSRILCLGAAALQSVVSPDRAVSIIKHRGRGFTTRVGSIDVYTVATYHPAAVLRDPDYFRDFAKDVEKVLTHTGLRNDAPDVFVLWKKGQALRKLTELFDASVVSCDIETTGFDVTRDFMLSVGFGVLYADESTKGASFIVPRPVFQDPEVRELLVRLLNEHAGVIVLHNGKFDLKFLRNELNAELRPRQFADTMLMHYVLDERPMGRYSAHGLKDLARFHFDADDYAMNWKEFFNSEITKEALTRLFYYQGQDCYYTVRLFDELGSLLAVQRDKYEFRGHEVLSNLLYPASFMLSEVEAHGVLIDTDYLREFASETEETAHGLRDEIEKLVCASTKEFDEFNPGSTVQLRKLLYDVWGLPRQVDAYHPDTNDPTSKEVIQRLAQEVTDPVRRQVLTLLLKWRQQSKLLSTYAGGLLKKVSASDSRIRPSFALHGTSTGRLACSEPNLQNIPNKIGKQVQHAFVAPTGFTYVCADYSQLELRCAGYYSNDPVLIDIFERGADIHLETSIRLFNKPGPEITPLERKLTKTIVFGIIYGRGPRSILDGKEMQYLVEEQGVRRWTFDEAKAFQQKFLSTYPGLREWLERMQHNALSKHFVETPLGRRRRFPLVLPNTRAEIMRQAANMPIQSLASDICLSAMTRLHDRLKRWAPAHVLMSIHDEIQLEVPTEMLPEVLPLIRDTMEHELPIESTIPFRVEIKTGSRWSLAQRVPD